MRREIIIIWFYSLCCLKNIKNVQHLVFQAFPVKLTITSTSCFGQPAVNCPYKVITVISVKL